MPRQFSASDHAARAYTIGVSGSIGSGKTMLLALCRLLRDNYSIAVVTSHTATDQDSSREFLIRHKALASTRIAAVDRGRDIEGAIESLMTDFRPELIFLEAADSDREPMETVADFTIHVVDGSADRISSKDVIDATRSDLLVINKTHIGAPLDVERNIAVRQCVQAREDRPLVFAQLRYGIGTVEIARHFLASWRRTSAPEVWELAVEGPVALAPA
jgi:urease accessory protein